MTTFLKIGRDHLSHPISSVCKKQIPLRAGLEIEKGSGAFKKTLAGRLEKIKSMGNFPATAQPLRRDQLFQLIETIQMQMNEMLFRELSGFDEDFTPKGFQFDRMNLAGIGNSVDLRVSKFQHTPFKTKRFQSDNRFDPIIDYASKMVGLDPDLTRAVIRTESDFNPDCTSHKGAMGLMQLMPKTAKELGVQNSYDPFENIMAGTRYLKSLLDRYEGNIPLALAAYNWGMGNVERNPEKIPRETRNYITRVSRFYNGAAA